MLTRPAYSECKLYYDGSARVEVGHFLKTPAGSAYHVMEVRQHKTRAYRVNLNCLRWPVAEIPAEATVHPLHWYKREKRRGVSLTTLRTRAA